MSVSRRTVLKGAAGVGAVAALPAAARADDAIVVFDSRLPEARAYAVQHGARLTIDIAAAESEQWRAFRMLTVNIVRVVGLTGWGDWVVVRGFLEERGFRLRSEAQVAAPLSGKTHLFRWEMG